MRYSEIKEVRGEFASDNPKELAALRKERDANFEKYIGIIKRNCQPYLSQVDDPISLYKGTTRKTAEFQRKKVRLDDRRPVGASGTEHVAYNEYFKSEFGAPFRNSVLVTGSHMDARSFGTNIRIVFPAGEFRFVWSPKVNDINMSIGFRSAKPRTIPELVANMVQYEYRDDNLQAAIDSGNEIMIRCKEYYTINYHAYLEHEADVRKQTGYDITRLFK